MAVVPPAIPVKVIASVADLARAEAAGQTLMRVGHRWVRIDPDGLRRARRVLEEQIEERSRVGAVELLQLAAGGTDEPAPIEPPSHAKGRALSRFRRKN